MVRIVRVLRMVKASGPDDGVSEEKLSADVAEFFELDPVPPIMSSVAPTDQCAGYTGMAYARTSLYEAGDRVERTSDVGGKDVNDVKV